MSDVTRQDIAAAAADEARRLCAVLAKSQLETLVLASKGFTMSEIAEMQGITYLTAAEHAKEARRRLGVGSMIEAAVIATKAGLV
jgi:DNA-binding NarL/FixJ family response regulator